METLAPYQECPTSLSCYAWDVWQFIDWQAIVIAICFWVAAMMIAYSRGETGEVKRVFTSAVEGTIATLVVIGLLLLGFIIYSPWQRYKTLREYAESRDAKLKEVQSQEPLRIAHHPLVRIGERGGFTSHEFILDTNQTVNPVRFTVNCDGDIADLYPRMLGQLALGWAGWKPISKRRYDVDLSSEWRPTSPLLLTIYSGQKEMKCDFTFR